MSREKVTLDGPPHLSSCFSCSMLIDWRLIILHTGLHVVRKKIVVVSPCTMMLCGLACLGNFLPGTSFTWDIILCHYSEQDRLTGRHQRLEITPLTLAKGKHFSNLAICSIWLNCLVSWFAAAVFRTRCYNTSPSFFFNPWFFVLVHASHTISAVS